MALWRALPAGPSGSTPRARSWSSSSTTWATRSSRRRSSLRLRAAYPDAVDRGPGLAEQPRGLRGRPRGRPRPPGGSQLVRASARDVGRWARPSGRWDGRSGRDQYDLGIDVRGDILTVFVLALAGIPRRLGWAMGGGGFLLTDVARWVPGRHEVESRRALLDRLGLPGDEPATRSGSIRPTATGSGSARMLREAWPGRSARVPALAAMASTRTRGIGRPRRPRNGRARFLGRARRPPCRPVRRPVPRCWPSTWVPGPRPSAGRPGTGEP